MNKQKLDLLRAAYESASAAYHKPSTLTHHLETVERFIAHMEKGGEYAIQVEFSEFPTGWRSYLQDAKPNHGWATGVDLGGILLPALKVYAAKLKQEYERL